MRGQRSGAGDKRENGCYGWWAEAHKSIQGLRPVAKTFALKNRFNHDSEAEGFS
jgi:prenyltransferase beta subunit